MPTAYRLLLTAFLLTNDRLRLLPTLIEDTFANHRLFPLFLLSLRYLQARPLKRKTQTEVKEALISIFAENEGPPGKIHSDLGTEFGFISGKFAQEWDFEYYPTKNTVTKNSMTEIANRFLQNRLYKYLTAHNTLNWIDHLGNILAGINNTKRRVLFGYSSVEARQPKISEILKKKFAFNREKLREKYEGKVRKFSIHDRVKVIKKKKVFDRGYVNQTEDGVDYITSCLDTYPPTFRLKFRKSRPYYSAELISYPESKTTSTTPHHVTPDYYITDEKQQTRRTHRSGTATGEKEKLYKIKSHSGKKEERWISENEKKDLIRNGVLASD